MTRWIGFVVFCTVAQTMMFGCCAFAPKNPCLEQEQANAALQARNKALEDSLQRKDADLARVQSDVSARDAKIAELANQLANQPPPAVKIEAAPTAPTGFEGTGEVTRRGRAVIVTIASDVLFDSGKAVVKEKRALEKIASVINSKYPTYKVRVRGHTDDDPIVKSGWKDNWDLGFNRARAVAILLISGGVAERNVEIDSLENNEPRGAGKAKDRRVEIQVAPADE
jgi:flagellar motor protein MotB